jgi:hypothetical protein
MGSSKFAKINTGSEVRRMGSSQFTKVNTGSEVFRERRLKGNTGSEVSRERKLMRTSAVLRRAVGTSAVPG